VKSTREIELPGSTGMETARRRRASSLLTTFVPCVLFVVAIVVLCRELRDLSPDAIMQGVHGYDAGHLMLAVACTLASFLTLSVIELLALRYIGGSARVPRATALATGFVAHAVSQSVGLALLTGAAVRLRAYSRHALDTVAVAKLSGFVTVTVTLGLLTTGAVTLSVSPMPLRIGRAVIAGRPLGATLALIVLAYLLWSVAGRQSRLGGRWRLGRPSLTLAVAQILLSSLDWLLTGTVLFALLPGLATMSYVELLRIYLTAQIVAVASHVPGGVGVFELVVLALYRESAATQRAALVTALVMFRVVYYVLPLVAAGVVAAAAELSARRDAELPTAAPAS
jgi:uncharacterized membrane protein YbhN (UPF0104 family)